MRILGPLRMPRPFLPHPLPPCTLGHPIPAWPASPWALGGLLRGQSRLGPSYCSDLCSSAAPGGVPILPILSSLWARPSPALPSFQSPSEFVFVFNSQLISRSKKTGMPCVQETPRQPPPYTLQCPPPWHEARDSPGCSL